MDKILFDIKHNMGESDPNTAKFDKNSKDKEIIIGTRIIYRKIFLIQVYIFHKPNIYIQI